MLDLDRLLDLEMQGNDCDATTIRDYLHKLLREVWVEQDGFSGKRPFGNSSWEYDMYIPLIKDGIIDGKFEDDDPECYIESVDSKLGHKIILQLIDHIFGK